MRLPLHLQRIEVEDVAKVKELGRGQFGSVWLGRWLGIPVAMKELHCSDGRSRQVRLLPHIHSRSCDSKFANRTIRVWHGATENGP
jgi:hypothetical protein